MSDILNETADKIFCDRRHDKQFPKGSRCNAIELSGTPNTECNLKIMPEFIGSKNAANLQSFRNGIPTGDPKKLWLGFRDSSAGQIFECNQH